MKNLLIFALTFFLALTGFSQKRVLLPADLNNYAVKKPMPLQETEELIKGTNPYVKNSNSFFDEVTVGNTRYDNQNNASMQNRLYLYNDGTLAATWIFGTGEPDYTNRGTGYNYFDGSNWGDIPSVRIEDVRTGWPSYAPLGTNGEIVVTHTAASGLYISKRDQKGTGTWNYSPFPV